MVEIEDEVVILVDEEVDVVDEDVDEDVVEDVDVVVEVELPSKIILQLVS